jgi:hypothetical protein
MTNSNPQLDRGDAIGAQQHAGGAVASPACDPAHDEAVDDALSEAGAHMMRLVDRADEAREAAAALMARADELGPSMTGDLLRQAAEGRLRAAAAREHTAQAIQILLNVARKATHQKDQDHVSP